MFGCNNCKGSERHSHHQLDLVIGVGSKLQYGLSYTPLVKPSKRPGGLIWIGKGVHSFNIEKVFGPEFWQFFKDKFKDPKIGEKHVGNVVLAFDHFRYYNEGYDVLGENLKDYALHARPSRIIELGSAKDPEWQQEVQDLINKTNVSGADPSPSLWEIQRVEADQIKLDINRIKGLLGTLMLSTTAKIQNFLITGQLRRKTE